MRGTLEQTQAAAKSFKVFFAKKPGKDAASYTFRVTAAQGAAASLGAPGLFAHGGLFSQYVIGTAELVASFILIATMLARSYRFLQPAGALLAIAIMSGAISFHLFTPLGVNVDNDGGSLFFTACGVWIGSWALLYLRRRELAEFLTRLRAFFTPAAR